MPGPQRAEIVKADCVAADAVIKPQGSERKRKSDLSVSAGSRLFSLWEQRSPLMINSHENCSRGPLYKKRKEHVPHVTVTNTTKDTAPREGGPPGERQCGPRTDSPGKDSPVRDSSAPKARLSAPSTGSGS